MSCGVTYWDLSVLQHIPGCQEPPLFSQPSNRCRTPPAQPATEQPLQSLSKGLIRANCWGWGYPWTAQAGDACGWCHSTVTTQTQPPSSAWP